MPWVAVQDEHWARVEELRRDDDGKLLGGIMDNGPGSDHAYGWTETGGRLGTITNYELARQAVERRAGLPAKP
jgi:hypothetical protein